MLSCDLVPKYSWGFKILPQNKQFRSLDFVALYDVLRSSSFIINIEFDEDNFVIQTISYRKKRQKTKYKLLHKLNNQIM